MANNLKELANELSELVTHLYINIELLTPYDFPVHDVTVQEHVNTCNDILNKTSEVLNKISQEGGKMKVHDYQEKISND